MPQGTIHLPAWPSTNPVFTGWEKSWGGLSCTTLIVQEGGYPSPTLALSLAAFLKDLSQSRLRSDLASHDANLAEI
ncbi:hypothetical protein MesoLj113b_73200 (plasmid) [Mesorhizobium sp. 113-3-3]|nr:hypothetical protein MesoLj113b_73200 [Mesorhizobium sp. 113-3-3]